jgi:hypothetical protein
LASEPQTAFFSYSRDDSEFALRLAEDLKAAGANVWLDQLELEYGKPWDVDIQRALVACPRVVVILSPASAASPTVLDEVSFALNRQKTVIPVLYLNCEIPYRLERIQYIDFRTDYARGSKTLLKTLVVEQAAAAGRAAVSALRKDTAGDVSGADQRKRAAALGRLKQEERQAALQEGKRKQERKRKAADGPLKTGLKPEVPEGVYLDPETNLMWTIRDNGKDLNWHQANKYARQLRLGGYSNWRLPTIDKLEKLYEPQKKSDYKIRKPFQLTSRFVWSWAKEGSGSAWFFSYGDGRRYNVPVGYSSNYRTLCVRRFGK